MMTDRRRGSILVSDPRAGMMYSRLERDPRVETVRNREKDLGAGTMSNYDLERDLGVATTSNLIQERGLEVTMTNPLDLARGQGAETILSLIESRSTLISGETPTQTTRTRTIT